jgi:nicotinic acid mononucleotide adenylyltransferase
MGAMKSFKQYNEAKEKEVVFTFGRFNPPTIGHGKLIDKVASLASGNDYRIYASQSTDAKKESFGV